MLRSSTTHFRTTRRRLLQAAALAPAAVLAAPNDDLAGVTLRVGTYKGNWRALLDAAGLQQAPYRIDWRELNNGVLHIEAINGDALDLGSGSEIPPVFAARQKAQLKLVAAIHEDLNNQVTVARKDAPAQSIADLKGRRVGYVRATTAHYFLGKQLAEAGLSFNDIQAVNLSPADGLSAFARGDLDAWAIYGAGERRRSAQPPGRGRYLPAPGRTRRPGRRAPAVGPALRCRAALGRRRRGLIPSFLRTLLPESHP